MSSEQTEIERLQEELEMLQQVQPLMIELELARETRHEDRDRWNAAVEALDGPDGARTYWRRIADFLRAAAAEESGPAPETVLVAPEALSAGGN